MDARDARDGDDVDAQAVDDVDGAAWADRLRSGSRLRDVTDNADTDDDVADDGNNASSPRTRASSNALPTTTPTATTRARAEPPTVTPASGLRREPSGRRPEHREHDKRHDVREAVAVLDPTRPDPPPVTCQHIVPRTWIRPLIADERLVRRVRQDGERRPLALTDFPQE